MKKNYFIFTLLLVLSSGIGAQDENTFASKGFTIVLATKNYDRALKLAKEASKSLELEFKSRGNSPAKQGGLTSDEVCSCGIKHGYVPRGRYDDGEYVSIEYSNNYESFRNGYYIVMVCSGDPEELVQQLPKIKEHYHDAYIKNDKVYLGCMH